MKKIPYKTIVAVPLLLGILSFLSLAVYFYSANHAPYNLTQVIVACPVFSLLGVIISIITRRSRKTYPALWTSGLIICMFSLVLCVLIIILLACIATAMFNGNWL